MSVDLGDIVLLPSKMAYIRSLDAVVLADLHIGLEYAMAEAGVFIPPIQYKIMKEKLRSHVKRLKPKRIIIVGDLKHVFSQRTVQEHKEVVDMLKFLKSLNLEIILVRGNHDNFLIGILKRYGIDFQNTIELGNYIFLHGHKIFDDEVIEQRRKTLIMAHLHPTVMLSDSISRDKLPIFLVSDKIIVLPAFTPLLPGIDVIAGSVDSGEFSTPIIKDLIGFEIFVVVEDKKVLYLGSVDQISRMRELQV